MSDPMSEIFNGTPEAIDEEDIKHMESISQSTELPAAEEEEQPQAKPQQTSQESQPTKPKASTETKPKEQTKEQTSIFDEGYDAGDLARNVSEAALSMPVGALDFGVETLNLIPGVDAPKLPKFHNNTATVVRDIFSVVGPTIGLTMAGQGGLAKAAAAPKLAKLKILADPLFKKLATMSFGAGVGAGVDAISEQSEDHNLLGVIKQSAPAWIADRIPDSMATVDGDSPDQKRNKNIMEGVGLGLFTDVIGGVAKLARNLKGVDNATRYIPESEKARNWLAKNAEPEPETALEVMEKSAAKRSDDLDDLGAQTLSKSQNLDEPIAGIHDMFGYEELGVRSADDMGIIGASVDQVRIANNLDTSYGRLGSVMSDSAMKHALEGAEEYGSVLKGLRETLSDAGEYGYKLQGGGFISSKTIKEGGAKLASDLNYVTNDELEQFLETLKVGINPDTGAKMMSSEGMAAVKIAIKQQWETFNGMADALVRTSVAGQVSDMAEGMRYSTGSAAYQNAQGQILDRLELLMVANGETGKQRGNLLNMMNIFKRGGKQLTPDELRAKGADITRQLQAEAKATRAVLQEVSEKNPEMLGPLLLAYEATNGSVKGMDALNNYVRNSTGVFSKALIDMNPEIPSVVMRSFWSNVYNNVLSAFATPIRAMVSNGAVLLEQTVTPFAGALMAGDGMAMRRAAYTLKGYGEAMANGRKYYAETMRRSALDPDYAGVAGRESMLKQDEAQMEVLNAFAEASAAKGDFGPQALLAQVEAMDDLAKHPWLRIGNRSMQATDGFTQAFMGTLDARGKAFDQVHMMGRIDADAITEYQEYAYKQLWGKDEKGRQIITDKALKYAAGEVAMNNANSANDAISGIIRHVPMLKPFLLFTKTPLNMMGFAATHTPMGRFIKEEQLFSMPFNQVPIDKVKEALAARQIPFDEMAEINYNKIRQEMKGRKAMGTVYTMGAATLFLNSSLTGDGVADRQTQTTRRDADWKKRSFKTPTGQWVSYDGLGALSDVVALTANIMDNFDTLGEANLQKLLTGVGFVLSASVTDKTMLAGIEPIYDIVNGNGAAINRWSSSFVPSAVLPGSSQMAELTRLISPNLRVVEEQFFAMLANRTPAKLALPEQYDWISGEKVNEPGNIMARLWNTYSPMKVSGKISPEKQFLLDIEYDNRPSMATDGSGVKLTIDEQAQVYKIMGQRGGFKKAVQRVMNTTTGKKFREDFRKLQSQGGSADKGTFQEIQMQLDRALAQARDEAIAQIDAANNTDTSIQSRREEAARNKQQSMAGSIEPLLNIYR